MSKSVVIIGGGLSAKHSSEILVKNKGLKVTIIQANRFVEWPLAAPVFLVDPSKHDKAIAPNSSTFQVPGVNYIYGVVEGVDVAAKRVIIKGGAPVAYDALIVATGFRMPVIYPDVGVSLDERKAEVQRVGDAIKNAKCVVIGGGGPVGLELAGDIRIEYPNRIDKKVVLLCRGGLLSQWPEANQQKVATRLEKMGIDVMVGGDGPTECRLEPGTVKVGDKDLAYDIYLPAFSQGPNTTFLQKCDGVLDAKGGIDVNEFMQSKACPEIFAVGCSNVPEWVGMPKLEQQWKDATANVAAMLGGKKLKPHKEGLPFMKLPVALVLGHGPKGYAYLDFNNMPPPLKVCCCCGYGGFPCCPPCWSCCLCGGCGACPCGYCCGPPEGSGTAKFFGKMAFMSSGFHFKGVGEAPKQQHMS